MVMLMDILLIQIREKERKKFRISYSTLPDLPLLGIGISIIGLF